jgi:hypothetical protein
MHHWRNYAYFKILILSCLLLVQYMAYGQNDIAHTKVALVHSFTDTSRNIDPSDTSSTSLINGDDDNNDEILITLHVPRIGSIEIAAYIYGEAAYLSVKDLFDFLKIKNSLSTGLDTVQGYFINPAATYFIDEVNAHIIYNNKKFDLKKTDIIRTETNLYLRTYFFGKVFGLECIFNFHALSVTLNTKLELPVIREMQQELIRQNISKLKGEKIADTSIKRSAPFFHFGTADWAFISTQEKGFKNIRGKLDIGAVIAGGDANIMLNYDDRQPFKIKDQFYNWRYVNNNHAALRQVIAGKMPAQSTATLYAPVTGIQLTNSPSTYRRSFGSYTLSNVTEPGWIVELYVNNVLINYTKADASGFFSFEVPMIYGSSVVKLRLYSPWGEEQVREQNMNIPFNFVPLNQLEYSVNVGIVNEEKKGLYTRANLNYGLSRRITIGTGMEYLSTVSSGKIMPYINATVRLGDNMLISGEHVYGVRSKGVINFRLPSKLQFDLNFTKYSKMQTAVQFNYFEEKKLVVTMPFNGSRFTALSRLTVNRFSLMFDPLKPETKTENTSSEFLLSAMVAGISSNFTTYYAFFAGQASPVIYSHLSLAFRLPARVRLTPRAQYDYNRKNFTMVKGEVEKNVFRNGFANIFYEKNIISKVSSVGIGLRYNFSFVQTSFSARKTVEGISLAQTARGSIMYSRKERYLNTGTQNTVGKGGVTIAPFLDLNCNGAHDDGEPRVFGMKLKVNGARIEQRKRSSAIRILGMEAYTNYYIEIDKNSLDNIAWQIQKSTLSVEVIANEHKVIEVPVAVVGEVSGTVYLKNKENQKGLERIIVRIYNSDSVLVAKTLTEQDGYFSYLGLAPGAYTATLDAGQLRNLKMSTTGSISFRIKLNKEGDVVDGQEFIVEGTKENEKNGEKKNIEHDVQR